MNPNPREEIKKLIIGNLEQKLSTKDGNRHQKAELKSVVESRAEVLLSNFEKSLLIKEVKQLVVNDCKSELLKTSKREKSIEAILFVLAIIFSLLIGILSFGSDITLINWAAKGCLLLCAIQIGLYIYMKIRSD